VQVCNLGGLGYVNFLDESKFNLCGLEGRQYCWRMSGECLLDQHV
jgi:hypothetical protein